MSTHEHNLHEQANPSVGSSRGKPRRRTLRRAAADGIASVANRLRFLVGRDEAGRWLALEDHGLAGGIFASKEAALHYAVAETGRRPGGVRLARRAISFRI